MLKKIKNKNNVANVANVNFGSIFLNEHDFMWFSAAYSKVTVSSSDSSRWSGLVSFGLFWDGFCFDSHVDFDLGAHA